MALVAGNPKTPASGCLFYFNTSLGGEANVGAERQKRRFRPLVTEFSQSAGPESNWTPAYYSRGDVPGPPMTAVCGPERDTHSPSLSTGRQAEICLVFWGWERLMHQALQLIQTYWLRLTLWATFLLGRMLA